MSNADYTDGLDLIRTEVRREMRKYERRIKVTAEEMYKSLYTQATLNGEAFDPEQTARHALSVGSNGIFGPPVIEGNGVAELKP